MKEYTDKVVNWTSVGADAYIEPSERLQFYWTGYLITMLNQCILVNQ